MMSHSSLMPFESLIDYLSSHGFANRLDAIMQIRRLHFDSNLQNPKSLNLSDECCQKFANTWWEVCWPSPKADLSNPPQCMYLADSLRDALRLRPNINIMFWPDRPKSFAKYLICNDDWSEYDDELAEEAVMECP